MQQAIPVTRKYAKLWGLACLLLFATASGAEEDWGFDLEAYGWLPIIEFETETGQKDKITREDILSNLDIAAMWNANLHKGKWSLNTDFIYFKVSNDKNLPLFSDLPDLAELQDLGLQAWIIRPTIGYRIFENDKHEINVYGGAKYIWIELDLKFDLPSGRRKDSPAESNWDAVAGIRGNYQLTDKWFIPYSANAGAGDSDFTWEIQTALGYRFDNLDAIVGWRYLDYDLGSDTPLRELTVNGPFIGAIFHW